jgi:hypothetical protein
MNLRHMEINTTKAMGLTYLAQAISDFKTFPIQADKSQNQVLSIVVHGVNIKNWKFVITEIYYTIERYIAVEKQRDWDKKAAMIASLDYEGSRTGNLNEKLKLRPHIHALVVLPDTTAVDIEKLEWYLNANDENIQSEAKRAMFKKEISNTDQLDYDYRYFSINVDQFAKKPKVCFTTAVSYQIKGTSFLNADDLLTPVVYPFDLKLMKIRDKPASIMREKEKAHQLLQDLIFDPRKYFAGDLFEIDYQHEFFLKQYEKLIGWPDDALMQVRKKAVYFIENKKYEKLGELGLILKAGNLAAKKERNWQGVSEMTYQSLPVTKLDGYYNLVWKDVKETLTAIWIC